MTNNIMSSVSWDKLIPEEQTKLFSHLKTLSKYNNRTYRTNNIDGRYIDPREVIRGYIYRPLKELPDNLKHYKSYLETYFGDGEMLEFHNKQINYLNYTILSNWINGNCVVCGSNSLQWDTRDKSIEYYCISCSSETFFINNRYEYNLPEVPY